MVILIKDLISMLAYFFMAVFCRNKKTVLLYHSIDNLNPDKDPYKMNVTPELFEKHLKVLSKRKNDYILTFDDGFRSIYVNALPLLEKYKIKSIIFIPTDYIDSKMTVGRFFKNRHYPEPLTWPQINKMRQRGIEIGSHGLSHCNMADLDRDTARREASASRERIKTMTGRVPDSFSYPFGNRASFNKSVGEMLKGIGYKRAYTNMMGMDNSGDEPFMIKRIRIYSTDNMFRFRMKVRGAYNWVDFFSGYTHLKNNQ